MTAAEAQTLRVGEIIVPELGLDLMAQVTEVLSVGVELTWRTGEVEFCSYQTMVGLRRYYQRDVRVRYSAIDRH